MPKRLSMSTMPSSTPACSSDPCFFPCKTGHGGRPQKWMARCLTYFTMGDVAFSTTGHPVQHFFSSSCCGCGSIGEGCCIFTIFLLKGFSVILFMDVYGWSCSVFTHVYVSQIEHLNSTCINNNNNRSWKLMMPAPFAAEVIHPNRGLLTPRQ